MPVPAAHEEHDAMASIGKALHEEHDDEVPRLHGVGGRVDAQVHGALFRKDLFELGARMLDEAARLQLFGDGHMGDYSMRAAGSACGMKA